MEANAMNLFTDHAVCRWFLQRRLTLGTRFGRFLRSGLHCLLSLSWPFAQSSDPLRTIVPVQFDPISGDINVGKQTYSGKSPGFHSLALRRQPEGNHPNQPDELLNQTDSVRYDLAADRSIKIGARTYTVANARYQRGYNAAAGNSSHPVVDRELPDLFLASSPLAFAAFGYLQKRLS